MIDASTKKPLRVSTKGGAYIMVQVQQLDDVRNVFDNNNISYWVDEFAISLNGEPEEIVVNLGRGTNAEAVQKILDGVS